VFHLIVPDAISSAATFVVLGLFADPAGKAMGAVEMAGGKPKTPSWRPKVGPGSFWFGSGFGNHRT